MNTTPAQGMEGLAEQVRAFLFSHDLYEVLMNLQNKIRSPVDAEMANGVIIHLDKVRALVKSADAVEAATPKGDALSVEQWFEETGRFYLANGHIESALKAAYADGRATPKAKGDVDAPKLTPPSIPFNDDTKWILSLMCFQVIRWVQVYRAAGVEIPTKAEAEQAFILHKLLNFYLAHGADWRKFAEADLVAAHEAATPKPASVER